MLTHSQNHVYPLQRDEFDALRESIKQHGIQTPVLIGDHTVIDGRHRCLVAQELNVEVPSIFLQGLTQDQEHEIALAVNSVRRQMSQKQKHEIVRRELIANWNKSDRSLAVVCGVTPPTVGRIREELRREREVKPTPEQVRQAHDDKTRQLREPEVRTDARGREFVVQPKPPRLSAISDPYRTCPACGVMLKVGHDPGVGYYLIHERD